ncbi:uncharacterized protein FOMMEDRAFT_166637 [Fomitiporia mediterranea MF3/22]|uniref:uncharacterized protein n=1 Tax=Fomitiporia mediterranea (strain MF3/22) TaxID=694068 RepID=UPI0004407A1D|nr:uncharacterized protein FOMMEDRAFT_166637 [Fomitiporia mediterranea MF3/22]EJD04884.1 hypothetical protein FOMMEDRAFT_166637 [Fomitiporia mediterranea MF3/22]
MCRSTPRSKSGSESEGFNYKIRDLNALDLLSVLFLEIWAHKDQEQEKRATHSADGDGPPDSLAMSCLRGVPPPRDATLHSHGRNAQLRTPRTLRETKIICGQAQGRTVAKKLSIALRMRVDKKKLDALVRQMWGRLETKGKKKTHTHTRRGKIANADDLYRRCTTGDGSHLRHPPSSVSKTINAMPHFDCIIIMTVILLALAACTLRAISNTAGVVETRMRQMSLRVHHLHKIDSPYSTDRWTVQTSPRAYSLTNTRDYIATLAPNCIGFAASILLF